MTRDEERQRLGTDFANAFFAKHGDRFRGSDPKLRRKICLQAMTLLPKGVSSDELEAAIELRLSQGKLFSGSWRRSMEKRFSHISEEQAPS